LILFPVNSLKSFDFEFPYGLWAKDLFYDHRAT